MTATTPNTPTYFQQQQPTMSPAIDPPSDPPSQPSTLTPIPTTAPIVRKHTFPVPLLRLEFRDLAHEGSSIFLTNIHGNEDLSTQVQNVLNLLYCSPKETPASHRPGTRSVTFIIRAFDGVAYTTGLDLDNDHKEIHISIEYIKNCARGGDKRRELLGVICHELVHCFQWDAEGTCPGGLIEGIADWVRLRAGLGAAHWKQEASGEWDGGYQKTGYFLEWLERKFGEGTVRRMNGYLRKGDYDGEKLFGECCEGKKVEELWKAYRKDLEEEKGGDGGDGEEGPANPIPTHPAKRE